MNAAATTSPWPHRFAVATFVAAIPLLLFGGTVTTLEAGMAIDGWLVLEPGRGDHFLLFYPVDKWFLNDGTFAEHTHRLFGALVGLLSIATVVAAFRLGARGRGRFVALGALALVCAQGALGGLRVLENSPELAFLHGAIAQFVFAFLGFTAVQLSPRFQGADLANDEASTRLMRSGLLALTAVYLAIFAGAWLRHAVSHMALSAHILLVAVAIALVFHVAALFKRCGQADPSQVMLCRAARNLHMILGVQVLLGFGSLWIVFIEVGENVPEVHQSIFPTLHVLFGALLLAQLLAAVTWTRRRLAPPEAGTNAETSP
jgi:cytochrome c oxidase assembly protein subunit 15